MQIVVTAACSPVGQALLRALCERGCLQGPDGVARPLERILAVDHQQTASLFVDDRVEYVCGHYGQGRFLAHMMGVVTDAVFHLVAAPAIEVEAGDRQAALDAFEDALALTVDTTRALVDACSHQQARPRVVFAGLTGPDPFDADLALACETLLAEAGRRLLVEARAVRLAGVLDPQDAAARIISLHEQA
jgi:nucleoside-diphosphate-sugar epimerase